MSDPVIRINKMNKWFGNFHVLRDIDLNVAAGEKIVICGRQAAVSQRLFAVSIGSRRIKRAKLRWKA